MNRTHYRTTRPLWRDVLEWLAVSAAALTIFLFFIDWHV